ncbi:MAG: Holliday junction resolvase RuvX [Planctomycetota bacterium]
MAARVIRYVGVDLGDKRTGLALADSLTRLPAPWTVLEVPLAHQGGDALLAAIERAIRGEFGSAPPMEVVVGLPLHMDGAEGDRARLARSFAGRLAKRLGVAVHLADERLTSKQADWALGGSGLTHKQKKMRRDAIAAAGILAGFLRAADGDADGNPPAAHPNNEAKGRDP